MIMNPANYELQSKTGHHHENHLQEHQGDNLELISEKEKQKVTIWTDIRALMLIITFYFNQGVMGGYLAVVNVRLTELKATNDELNLFSYYNFPYSIKFLYGPLIDTYYFKNFGKRKTYVVPCYYISSLTLIVSSFFMDSLVANKSVHILLPICLLLEAIICLKDVTVDGWNVKMLHEENISYAGFCQLFGQTIGGLVGYNLFIWANSLEYSNAYIWPEPRDYPFLTHQIFLIGLAGIYTSIAILVHFFIKEKSEANDEDVSFKETFRRIKGMCSNKNLRNYLISLVFLQGGINVVASIGSTVLIRDKGFDIERLSLLLLICTPISMIFMFFGSYFSKIKQDLSISIISVYLSIPISIVSFFLIYNYDSTQEGNFMVNMGICYVLSNFIYSLEYVASSSFAFRITESKFGATILTLLYSTSNFSFFWPNTLSLFLFNYFSFWQIFVGATVFQIIVTLLFTKPYIEMEKIPKEEWDPVYDATKTE